MLPQRLVSSKLGGSFLLNKYQCWHNKWLFIYLFTYLSFYSFLYPIIIILGQEAGSVTYGQSWEGQSKFSGKIIKIRSLVCALYVFKQCKKSLKNVTWWKDLKCHIVNNWNLNLTQHCVALLWVATSLTVHNCDPNYSVPPWRTIAPTVLSYYL